MSSLFGRSSSAPSTATVTREASKDVVLSSPPEDSISDLAWSPKANFLAVASWDSKVRIYDVTQSPAGEGKAIINFDGPALGCAWSMDGTQVVGASADNSVRLLDLAANGAPTQQVAVHDAPVRSLRFFETTSGTPMVVTGSWDKTVKYWDLRQATPAGTLSCQDKVYSLDVRDQLLVIATAERHINVVNLTEPAKIFKTHLSGLNHQTRVVSCFIDGLGYGIGSTEGRCSFKYVDARHASDEFTFRCHRGEPKNNKIEVFSVNAISFHPVHGTFSTAGSDGTFHFWDKDARHRLKGYPPVGAPISATAFNHDGSIFSYAISYDWSKGYVFNSPQQTNRVMLHQTTNEECKPKQPSRRR